MPTTEECRPGYQFGSGRWPILDNRDLRLLRNGGSPSWLSKGATRSRSPNRLCDLRVFAVDFALRFDQGKPNVPEIPPQIAILKVRTYKKRLEFQPLFRPPNSLRFLRLIPPRQSRTGTNGAQCTQLPRRPVPEKH